MARLPAKQPIRATFSIQSSSKATGRWANRNDSRAASVEVSHDADGVRITIPQTMLDKAAGELQSRPGAWNNPMISSISAVSPLSVAEALDAHAFFLGLLNLGTVKSERRVMYQGRSVRLLVLTMHQAMTKSEGVEVGSIKVDSDEMSVWVADDNLALAAGRLRTTTAGFLMFKGHESDKHVYNFARIGDRLVMVHFERSGNGGGMGQEFQGTEVQTVTVH